MSPSLSRRILFLITFLLSPLSAQLFVPDGDPIMVNSAEGFDGITDATHADLNGDGHLDLISAHNSGQILIWQPGGDAEVPLFLPIPISRGSRFQKVVAGDVDKDGDVDILSVSYQRDPQSSVNHLELALWINDGASSPTFQKQQLITLSGNTGGSSNILIGDVNGDSNPDLIFSPGGSTGTLFYGNGSTPVQWTQKAINFPASIKALALRDINGDSKADLILLDFSRVRWAENPGGLDPSFSFQTLFNVDGDHLALAQITGSEVDILVGNHLDEWIRFYESDGNSSPSFTLQQTLNTSYRVHSIAVGDLNGDGIEDIASGISNRNMDVFYNDGSTPPVFVQQTFPTDNMPREVGIADLNGDLQNDIYHTSQGDSFGEDRVQWFRNSTTTPGTFNKAFASNGLPRLTDLSFVDLTRDGIPELLTASSQDNRVMWYTPNDPAGNQFNIQAISPAGGNLDSVHAVDLDQDGYKDLVVGTSDSDNLYWLKNDTNSPPGFGPSQLLHTDTDNIMEIASGDFDKDGDQDLVYARSFGVKMWINQGGSPLSGSSVSLGSGFFPGGFEVLDVNGDTWPDIRYVNSNTVTLLTNLQTDPPTFASSMEVSTSNYFRNLKTNDVDGDGDEDLVVFEENDPVWFESDGGSPPQYTRHVVESGVRRVDGSTIADLNGDGRVEWLMIDWNIETYEAYLVIYEQTSTPQSYRKLQFPLGTRNIIYQYLGVEDLNRDGLQDVLIGTANPNTLSYLRNQGGDFLFTSRDIAPSAILQGSPQEAILELNAIHGAGPLQDPVEWTQMELQLQNEFGNPFTELEAQALIKQLRLYRDDGSGSFDSFSDTLLFDATGVYNTSNGILSLTTGTDTVAVGALARYFVCFSFTNDAHSQTPNRIRLHIPEGSSPATFNANSSQAISAESAFEGSKLVLAISEDSDADSDGMSDLWELEHFVNHLLGNPNRDQDGDGEKNGDEYIADTDPLDRDALFSIQSILSTGTGIRIDGSPRRYYHLQKSDSLILPDWQPVPGQQNLPGNASMIIPIPASSEGFYRIEVSVDPK